MVRRYKMLHIAFLGLGLVLNLGPHGHAQPPPSGEPAHQSESQQGVASPPIPGLAPAPLSQPEGVEVLARGPVHEAFAQPTIRGPAPAPIIEKQPPKAIDELPPDQRPDGAHVQWIPGYWAWADDARDFVWVSGTYRAVPPGRRWLPGYWHTASGGWQWVAGLWAAEQQNEVDLLPAPPDPIEEAVPAAPDNASIFQPGTWVNRDGRYLWRGGFWTPYRVGWIWTPAGYTWTPGGYTFVDGYWDYPLGARGLLFAPVNIERRLWGQPGWSYRPDYVIHDDFLLRALFVRPSYHRYYFGDYFDQRNDRSGFMPWTDFRFGRGVVDPLFTYYGLEHRNYPDWSRDLRRLYADRRQDPGARPPRTLAQQVRMLQASPGVATHADGGSYVRNMTALAPLARAGNSFGRLRPVTGAQRLETQRAVSQFRTVSAERGRQEVQAANGNLSPVRAGEPRRAVTIPLPKTRPAWVQTPGGPKAITPPAHPVMPALGPRPANRPGTATHPKGQPTSGRPAAGTRPEQPLKSGTPSPRPAPTVVPGKHPDPRPQPPARPAPPSSTRPSAIPSRAPGATPPVSQPTPHPAPGRPPSAQQRPAPQSKPAPHEQPLPNHAPPQKKSRPSNGQQPDGSRGHLMENHQ